MTLGSRGIYRPVASCSSNWLVRLYITRSFGGMTSVICGFERCYKATRTYTQDTVFVRNQPDFLLYFSLIRQGVLRVNELATWSWIYEYAECETCISGGLWTQRWKYPLIFRNILSSIDRSWITLFKDTGLYLFKSQVDPGDLSEVTIWFQCDKLWQQEWTAQLK